MNIQELVAKHLGKYKKVGIELKVKTCPFCKSEEEKFYINSKTGVFHCHKASCKANSKGNINILLEHLGIKEKIEIESVDNLRKQFKEDIKEIEINREHVEPLGQREIEYFENRGISHETTKKARVLKSNKTGDLLFFLTAGQQSKNKAKIVGVKTRSLEKNIKCIPGSQSFLLFWELIPKEQDTIMVTEGEIDALSLIEAGYDNACSIPFGVSNVDWIENQMKWLQTKKHIILWFDNDEAGKNGLDRAINRLKLIKGLKISVVENHFWKDANEVLVNEGINSIIESIEKCKEKNDTGVVDITEISRFDLNSIDRFLTGVKGLDLTLRGFKETEAIVIAGDNGSGKTTFVGQVVLNSIEQNKKVFMYNGELSDKLVKEWIYGQSRTKEDFYLYTDNLTGSKDWRLKDEVYKDLDSKLKSKIFVNTELERASGEILLVKMQEVYEKYNCFLYVIDNLSTLTFDNAKQRHDQLSDYVSLLKEFAKKNKVCLVIINHVTKNKDNDKSSIRGGTGVTDMADTVLKIEREKNEENDTEKSYIKILKNRIFGIMGKVETAYSESNKRIVDSQNFWEESKKQFFVKNEIEFQNNIELSDDYDDIDFSKF